MIKKYVVEDTVTSKTSADNEVQPAVQSNDKVEKSDDSSEPEIEKDSGMFD